MKRAYSQTQGSPPPSNIFQSAPAAGKAKKPRASGSHANTPLASSPPYYAADSPRGRSRSRSRSRSLSVVPGQGGGHKGKEREGSVVPPAGEGGEEGGEDVDGEDEELDYSDDEFGLNQRENARQKEDLRVLLEHFDAAQMDRYEAYRRSGLAKASVRKLVNQILQQSVSPSILTVVRGFSKVFVGEIVEKARAAANHPGPLTPADLREAYRVYQAEHDTAAGGGTARKKMFVR